MTRLDKQSLAQPKSVSWYFLPIHFWYAALVTDLDVMTMICQVENNAMDTNSSVSLA